MAGAAGPVDEPLAGILDAVLQGGQAGAAAEALGEFGRGWEPNPSPEPTQCCGFGQGSLSSASSPGLEVRLKMCTQGLVWG